MEAASEEAASLTAASLEAASEDAASEEAASLEAALYPADTSYYYYVARSDGSHIFSKTLDEHNAAIAEVNAASDTDEDENGEG